MTSLFKLSIQAADLFDVDSPDAATVFGRLGSVLFILFGLLAGATAAAAPDYSERNVIFVSAFVAVGCGAVAWALPWRRWPHRALIGIPAAGVLLLDIARWFTPIAGVRYLSLFVIIFMYVGVTQPPRWVAFFAAATVVLFAIPSNGGFRTEEFVTFVVTLAVSVLAGLSISGLVVWHRQGTKRIEGLLNATRQLTHTTIPSDTAMVLQTAALRLLNADSAMVLLSEVPGSARYTNPAPTVGAGPRWMATDIDDRPGATTRALSGGDLVFVTDPLDDPDITGALYEEGGIRSTMYAPLPGEGGHLGVLVVGFTTVTTRLNPAARQAVEVLTTESGACLVRQRIASNLAEQAATDGLTGLLNRRAVDNRLGHLSTDDTVVAIDLDHFKEINDTYGHETGDRVLKAFAGCLTSVCRDGDWCGRFGGDEFILVLLRGGQGGADSVLLRLRRTWDALDPLTGFSAGAAVHVSPNPPALTLANADKSLYEAKRLGRNRTQTGSHLLAFDAEVDHHSAEA